MKTFLIPRDPLLRWTLLLPKLYREMFPPPFDTIKAQNVFWGRNAIYHGLAALGISRSDTVLVPSYHCSAAIEPILQYGAQVRFFNVRRDCTPDFEDIRRHITSSTKAVLVIHYFGFPQPMQAWNNFCQSFNLKMIEDCAHVLTGEVDGQTLGTFGNVSVFSLRKFFPIYNGGQLIINDPACSYTFTKERPSVWFSLKIAKHTFDTLNESSHGWISRCLAWLVQRPSVCVQRMLSSSEKSANVLSVNSYGVDFNPATLNMPMSWLSLYLMRNCYSSQIVQQRRANYLLLLERLRSFQELVFPFPVLPKNVAPLVFPVIVSETDDFHLTLRDKGIPATTWGGVIHKQLSIEKFPDAQFLYKRLVFLPIHQDIRPDHIDLMENVIGESLRHNRDVGRLLHPGGLPQDRASPPVSVCVNDSGHAGSCSQ